MNFQASLRPWRFHLSFGAPPRGGNPQSFSSISPWESLNPGEYNADLQGRKALETYQKMRRSDAQIAAVEAIISLPIRAVKWHVEPAGPGAADREAAELIETNLFAGMAATWDDFLRQQLLAVLLGFAVHEQVLVADGRYVRWSNMAEIPQHQIAEFHYGPDGQVSELIQEGADSAGGYQRLPLAADRLLITTYRAEGGSAAGHPLLRSAYPHWLIKAAMYRIVNMGVENNFLGVPIAKVPTGTAEKQRQELLKMLEALRVRDRSGAVVDSDMIIELLEGKRNPMDVMPYIEHHDVMIARAALAQFLNLGATSTGARSLSEDHSRLFIVGEQTIATGIAENLNRHAIPRLCALNWPGMKEYPKIAHDHLRTVLNLEAIGNTLAQLVQGQLLTPDRAVEDRIRDLFDLPPLPANAPRPQDQPAAPPGDSAAADETTPDDDDPQAPPPKRATIPSRRPGNPAGQPSGGPDRSVRHASCRPGNPAGQPSGTPDTPVGPAVACHHAAGASGHPGDDAAAFAAPDIPAVGALFDQLNDDFQRAARPLLDEMIARLERASAPLLKKLDPTQPLARARLYPALAAIELPGRALYTRAVRDYLTALAEAGRAAAAEVTGRPAAAASRELSGFITNQAQLLSDRHLAELRTVFCRQVFDGATGNVGEEQAVSDAAQAARDRVSSGFTAFFRQALLSMADTLSLDLDTDV